MTSVDFDDQDPLSSLAKQEDPEMMDSNGRRLKLLISILPPFLGVLLVSKWKWHINHSQMQALKRIDDVVRQVIRDLKPPVSSDSNSADACKIEDLEYSSPADRDLEVSDLNILKNLKEDMGTADRECSSAPRDVQLVVFNLNILKSLKRDIGKIVSLHNHTCVSNIVAGKKAEHLVSSLTRLLQSLSDSIISEADIFSSVKTDIEQVEERIKYLISFIWLSTTPFFGIPTKRVFWNSAEKLAVKFSHQLFLLLVGDDELVGDHMRQDVFQGFIREINTLLLEIIQVYDGSMHDSYDPLTMAMKWNVLPAVDFLIRKLRLLSQLNIEPSFMVAVKDQLDILVDELSFLRYILVDLSMYGAREVTVRTQALIIETAFFVYLSLDKQEDGELMAKHLSFHLSVLLDAVDALRQHADDFFSIHFPLSLRKCPYANKLEFVNRVIKELEDLMCSEATSITLFKHQIEMVNKQMVTLRKCFSEISELASSKMEFLLTRFGDAAFFAWRVIHSFEGNSAFSLRKLGLYFVSKDVKAVQKEIKSLLKLTCPNNVPSVAMASSLAIAQPNDPPNINAAVDSKVEMQNRVDETNELVGLNDAMRETIEQLTGGSRQLKVLSIVGMPGLGKTTLADALYKHPSVDINFHVRAWCCLSQVLERETVVLSILDQIVQQTYESSETTGENVSQKLYQSLKGKRYLIVLDDVWDTEAWNGLKAIFPDDENGSRILFTTRSHAVALEAKSLPYALRLLSNEESYELLSRKLFNEDPCPKELSSISWRIASCCKGLPLALVLIAGTLKRTKRKKDSWKHVAKMLFRSLSIQEQLLETVEVSYKRLPGHLKPCFCYFGTVPEGTTISVSKLMRLWISEGFVQQSTWARKNLKQEAESYLNELIDRSLVMTARKSSKGAVKACRVHNVLQEFCTAKLEKTRSVAREDISHGIAVLLGSRHHDLNLFHISSNISSLLYFHKPNGEDLSKLPSSGALPSHDGDFLSEYLSELLSSGALPSHDGDFLSEYMFRDVLSTGRCNLSELVGNNNRLVLGTRTSQSRRSDYGSILKYRKLSVLDLGNVRAQSSAGTSDLVKIAKLVHLKYLAVRIHTREIPSAIGNLRNLETFLLSGAIGKVELPETIWKLVSLRELILDHSFFSCASYSQEFLENFSGLNNLKSISTLSIQGGNDEKFLRRLPNIEKLGCIFSSTWLDYFRGCNPFRTLEFLSELQSLKMSFRARAPYLFNFSFTSKLKKLTMLNACLPWHEISVIGQLPNLEVLKLLNKAFEGQQWDMREGEFQKLKFLKLESLGIVQWNASSEHLPCLERLVVLSCEQLEEIPSSFGEIPTLQLIEMKWCSASARNSVTQILEDQRSFSNDQFNVSLM